tara:strand:+ start:1824 stop:2393 length:570 start_codon:yes stop_codon:yes gene_type:complete
MNDYDLFAHIEQKIDASKFDEVSTEGVSDLSTLVRRKLQIDKDIEDAEQHLKNLKFQATKISTEDIPALMQKMGANKLGVDDHEVKIVPFVHARISEENKDKAHGFIRSVGEGDIIKNEVTVNFSAGQDNEAGAFVDELRSQGKDPNQKTYVHHSKLKAWVKERIAKGESIDMDLFSIHTGNEAKITRK